MIDWANEKIYGRFTCRQLYELIPNPESTDAILPLEKELDFILREIRHMNFQQLENLRAKYAKNKEYMHTLKNPYFEEKHAYLIARYISKVIKQIDSCLAVTATPNSNLIQKL